MPPTKSSNKLLHKFTNVFVNRINLHASSHSPSTDGSKTNHDQGLHIYCIVAAACMISPKSTVAEVFMSYALLLLQEISSRGSEGFKDDADSLLLENLCGSSSFSGTAGLLGFVEQVVQLHKSATPPKNSKNKNEKQWHKAEHIPPENTEIIISALFWETMKEHQDTTVTRLKLYATQILTKHAMQTTLWDFLEAESMSWSIIIPQSVVPSQENVILWCMKMFLTTMSNVEDLSQTFGWTLHEEDAEKNKTERKNTTIRLPLGANVFAGKPEKLPDSEDVYHNEAKQTRIDKKVFLGVFGSSCPAFAIQYGIHFMCIHARKADWVRQGTETIFAANRVNQMSASRVLALARVNFPISSKTLSGWKAHSADETELMQLKSATYDILAYVEWKAVVFQPDEPTSQDNFSADSEERSVFAPRKKLREETCSVHVEEATDEEITKVSVVEKTMFRFQDEWLNLRLEKNVSYDLFVMIRKLFIVSKPDISTDSKVGYFVTMKNQDNDSVGGGSGGNNAWDYGLIVSEITTKRKVGRTRGDAQHVVLYEALYRSGRVVWHEDGKDLDNENSSITAAHSFETLGEYLESCNTTLERWLGRYQHGIGSASPEADDEFVDEWKNCYEIE
jgi:hypothetical protein